MNFLIELNKNHAITSYCPKHSKSYRQISLPLNYLFIFLTFLILGVFPTTFYLLSINHAGVTSSDLIAPAGIIATVPTIRPIISLFIYILLILHHAIHFSIAAPTIIEQLALTLGIKLLLLS